MKFEEFPKINKEELEVNDKALIELAKQEVEELKTIETEEDGAEKVKNHFNKIKTLVSITIGASLLFLSTKALAGDWRDNVRKNADSMFGDLNLELSKITERE